MGPAHASDVLRRLESNLFAEIGDKPIANITAPVLLAAIRKIEHRGAHDLAHRSTGGVDRCSATASPPGVASAIRPPTFAGAHSA